MNTPDTEWELVSEDKWHQTWRHKEHGERQINTELLNFILTSHTTYWKERVRKETLQELLKEYHCNEIEGKGYDFYFSIRTKLDTLLDNLK